MTLVSDGGGSGLSTGYYGGIQRSDGVFENMITSSRYPTVSSPLSWLTPSISSSGSTARSITFKADLNNGTSSRTGYIYLSYNGNNAGSITVIQAGKPAPQTTAVRFEVYAHNKNDERDLWGTVSLTINGKSTSLNFWAGPMSDDSNSDWIDEILISSSYNCSVAGSFTFEYENDGYFTANITSEPAGFCDNSFPNIQSGKGYSFGGSTILTELPIFSINIDVL